MACYIVSRDVRTSSSASIDFVIHSISMDIAARYQFVHFPPHNLPYQALHPSSILSVRHNSSAYGSRISRMLSDFFSSLVSEAASRTIVILVCDGTMYFFVIFLANLMNALVYFVCIFYHRTISF